MIWQQAAWCHVSPATSTAKRQCPDTPKTRQILQPQGRSDVVEHRTLLQSSKRGVREPILAASYKQPKARVEAPHQPGGTEKDQGSVVHHRCFQLLEGG